MYHGRRTSKSPTLRVFRPLPTPPTITLSLFLYLALHATTTLPSAPRPPSSCPRFFSLVFVLPGPPSYLPISPSVLVSQLPTRPPRRLPFALSNSFPSLAAVPHSRLSFSLSLFLPGARSSQTPSTSSPPRCPLASMLLRLALHASLCDPTGSTSSPPRFSSSSRPVLAPPIPILGYSQHRRCCSALLPSRRACIAIWGRRRCTSCALALRSLQRRRPLAHSDRYSHFPLPAAPAPSASPRRPRPI
ncbi:hypothetical protein C8R44DRAFT_796746 [Mycena epipterygia]|nr:hypothetical protein C8R44DRAFT_796746 [Mycena epipterygia]